MADCNGRAGIKFKYAVNQHARDRLKNTPLFLKSPRVALLTNSIQRYLHICLTTRTPKTPRFVLLCVVCKSYVKKSPYFCNGGLGDVAVAVVVCLFMVKIEFRNDG